MKKLLPVFIIFAALLACLDWDQIDFQSELNTSPANAEDTRFGPSYY